MKKGRIFCGKQVISLLMAIMMLLPSVAAPAQAMGTGFEETAVAESLQENQTQMEGLLEETPEVVPEEPQEVTPEEVPEAVPEETPEAIPEETPEAIPEETPEAIPEETPEAVPEETLEVLPEEIPDGLPEIVGPAEEELLPELEAVSETPAAPSTQTAVAVAPPADTSKIVHIKTPEDMSKIDPADPNGYYVLDADITLGKYDYNHLATFCGTFDGRGYTITFNGRKSAEYLFKEIEARAVIQNVRFAGNIKGTGSNGAEYGPSSNVVRGSVINCVSEIEGGDYASGFTRDLDGGMISNCLSVGTAGNDAICKNYKSGSVENTYWTDALTSSIPAAALVNSGAKPAGELKGNALLEALNRNIDSNGCEWVMGEAGYPVLKPAPLEESRPEPERPPVSDEPVVYFETDEGQRVDMNRDRVFTMNALSQGTFKVEGAEEAGKTVAWACESITDYVNKHYWITSSGRYSPYSDIGRVAATATVNPGGTTIDFYIDNVSSNIVELKVFGQDRETQEEKEMSLDNPYITEGSKWVNLVVRGKLRDTDKWVTIPNSPALQYESDGNGMLPATGRFQVRNNAEAVFGVTFRENGGKLKLQFKATSKHVGVESFTVTVPKVWYIHEWNDLGNYWLGIKPGTDPDRQFQTSFKPANAGNKKLKWTALTPDIATYMVAFDNGIIPKKNGIARFEVTSEDNPSLKQIVEVEFKYLKPLTQAAPEKNTFIIKAGEGINFEIRTNEDASDQRFQWTYDKEDMIHIGDTVNVDPNSVDTPKWTTHQLTSLGDVGTVHVTGTPIDQTGGCKPVQFTVMVTADGQPPEGADVQITAEADVKHGVRKLQEAGLNKYSQEWSIFATLRAGGTIAKDKQEQYYSSVVEKLQSSKRMQPTDYARVVITLEAMGKDPTNVGGINLLERLYNSDKIENFTSNGAIWALIALDGWKSEIPANAKWTRDRLVDKILTYQTADGGFGLIDNQSCSIDMTAMALQALAPYQNKPAVKQATTRALQYLKINMQPDAGYIAEGGPNSCTAAQVLTALTALDMDPVTAKGFTRGDKNLVTNLHGFKVEAGGFGLHDGITFDGMSTEQVTYALAAYTRFAQGRNALYDLTDAEQNPTPGPAPDPTPGPAPDPTPAPLPDPLPDPEKPEKPEDPEKPEKRTVTLSVDLKTIGKGYIVAPTKVRIKEGHTVWDVLQAVLDAKGIDYEYENYTQYGSVYVQSIDGEGEFDHGPGSGWMYNVDGVYPEFGCSRYELEGGERIQWRYTTNLGKDLGQIYEGDDKLDKDDDKPDKENDLESVVVPTVKQDKDGQTQVEVTDKQIQSAITQAEKKQSKTIVIAPKMDKDASEVVVHLPKTGASKIADKTDADLLVRTAMGSVVIPNAALDSIVDQADNENIKIIIQQKSTKNVANYVNPELLKQASVMEVTVQSGKHQIHTFGGNKLVLNLSVNRWNYVPGETYEVVVISADGSMETMSGKCVKTGSDLAVQVATPHLSTFVVTAQKSMPFADIAGHWAQEAIQYVYSQGIMTGTENNLFSPEDSLTRAMMAAILYRKEGSPKCNAVNPFPDVQSGDWYADAVIWANAQGIISGTDGGRFAPDDLITREEMAVMLHRYARYKKYDIVNANSLSEFQDAEQISFWAMAAMEWANTTGLITGRTPTTIAPKGTATRAEIASILMRLDSLK